MANIFALFRERPETVHNFPGCYQTPLPYKEAVALSVETHASYLGKPVRPPFVCHPDLPNDAASPDLVARVVAAGIGDLENDTGTHLDPYWNLEIVSDPDDVCKGFKNVWTIGPSVEFVTSSNKPIDESPSLWEKKSPKRT